MGLDELVLFVGSGVGLQSTSVADMLQFLSSQLKGWEGHTLHSLSSLLKLELVRYDL